MFGLSLNSLKFKILSLPVAAVLFLMPVILVFLLTLKQQGGIINDIQAKQLTHTQQLASSITEIAMKVSDTSHVVTKATKAAKATNDNVTNLSETAQKISEVVSLIQDIAEQTKQSAVDVNSTTDEVSTNTANLQSIIDKFLNSVKAA